MKIAIVPGHTLSGKGTGATGYIDEGKENRILTDLIVKWLKKKKRGQTDVTEKP